MARTAADGAPPYAPARRRHGEQLRAARIAAGLHQRDLAAHLGVSQAAVSLMETGRNSCDRWRTAIAAVLGENWDTPAEEKTVPPGSHPGGHPAGPIPNGEEQMEPQQQNSRPRLAAPASNTRAVQA